MREQAQGTGGRLGPVTRWRRALPLALEDEEEGPVLVLAVVDPGDPRAADAVAEHTGLPVRMVRAPRDAIWARIVEHYRA